MAEMVVRAGGAIVYTKPVPEVKIKSKWSGELEKTRKDIVKTISHILVPSAIMTKLTIATADNVLAANASAEQIRGGFEQLLEVFTAIAEPILWFYALTACILMATKNKEAGWNRLKQVGYAYAGIALLPTFFAFLRWVANIIKGAITFS